jgi:hypothetical protein
MRRLRLVSLPVVLLPLGAFAAEPPVNFVEHVLPIFRNACLNCHNPDKKKAGLDLSTYEATMKGSEAGAVVTPGDSSKSLLFKLIAHTEEPVMPAKSDKLPDTELALIKKWIDAGGPEKSGSKVAIKKLEAAPVVITAEDKPPGQIAMPADLLLEPAVHTKAPGAITALAASRWAPLVALGGQRQVLLYDVSTLELVGVLPFPEGMPTVLRFSRNGSLVLAGGGIGAKLGRVVAWDVTTGRRAFAVGDEFDTVLAVDLSADQTRVALGGPNRLVKLLSTDGRLIKSIKKHTDWVTAISFNSSGRMFASGDRQGNLYVWEADGAELYSLAGHKGAITALASAGDTLVSASEDGTLKLWNMADGKQIKSWNAHAGGVLDVRFTADGRIVSAGRDRIARMWDAGGQQTLASEPLSDVALQTAFAGGRLVAGDWAGTVRVWGADGKRVGELNPNPPAIAERLVQAERNTAAALAERDRATRQLAQAREVSGKIKSELQQTTAAVRKKQEEIAALEQEIARHSALAKAAETARLARQQLAQLTQTAANAAAQAQNAQAAAELADRKLKTREAQLADAQRAAKLAADSAAQARREAEAHPEDRERLEAADQAQAAVEKANEEIASVEKTILLAGDDAQRQGELYAKLSTAQAETERSAKIAAEALPAGPLADEWIRTQQDALRRQLDEARAGLEKLRSSHSLDVAAKSADQALSTAESELRAAEARVADARRSLARWRAAEANIPLHAARDEIAIAEAIHQEREAALRVAEKPLTSAARDLKQAEEALAAAPARISAIEKRIVDAETRLATCNATVVTAERKVLHRSQLAEKSQAYADELGGVIAAEEPDAMLSEAVAAARKSAESLKASVASAIGAVEAAKEAVRAAEAHRTNEKSELAKARAAFESLPSQITVLRARLDEVTVQTASARSTASQALADALAAVQTAKAKATSLEQRYVALKLEAAPPKK